MPDVATTEPSTANPFYYVDGYHGGVDGHFPWARWPTCWPGSTRIPTGS